MARGRRSARGRGSAARRGRGRGTREWPPARAFAAPRAKRRVHEQAIRELLARERREVIGLIVEVAVIVGALVIVVVVLAHAGHR